MRYYCPECWHDFGRDMECCPSCGHHIPAGWDGKDFVDKLIAALGHPEPETPIRAAWILGRIGDARAVASLLRLLETTRDVYTAQAAVEALSRIGTQPALEAVRRAVESHPATMVRDAARAALAEASGCSAGAGHE